MDSQFKKYSRTKNRKTKSKNATFETAGETYPVNASGSGIYREMMMSIIKQLKIVQAIHGRFLVVQFILHSSSFDDTNNEITLFRKRIMAWITRNYQTSDIGFVWVRELASSDHQHYHFALFIDGQKIQHPKKLLHYIKQKWEAINPNNHHMPHMKKPFYYVDSDAVFKDVVYRLSYLAKTRGKGYRPVQTKDYNTSRLKSIVPKHYSDEMKFQFKDENKEQNNFIHSFMSSDSLTSARLFFEEGLFMSGASNSSTPNNQAAFIWSLADLLRGDFKQSQYGRVILPFTLLRRLEGVLEDSKEAVLLKHVEVSKMNLPEEAQEKLILRATNGLSFFNTSKMDLSKLGESGIKDNLEW